MRKIKLIACLTACCLAAPFIAAVSADSEIDSLATVSQHLLGKKPLELTDYLSADRNADNTVNIVDAALLKRSCLNGTAAPETAEIHLKDNASAVSGANVTVDPTGNIVTISASGEYYIDGALSNGQIIVNVPDEAADPGTVKLFLDGVSLACASEAPIYIINAENTSINLVDGTVSTVHDGASYTETEAAIFAKDDLTIKGGGTLNIIAGSQYAIHCNNDLKINCDAGGAINIETEAADALRGRTSLTVKSGTLTIDSKGDGIKSTKGKVTIEGGDIRIKAGNDAVQAETTLTITGGSLIAGGDRGLTGIDSVSITGGTVFAAATDNQCETLTANANAMLLNFAAEHSKDTLVILKSADGKQVFSAAAEKKFSFALIYSPELSDASYTAYMGIVQLCHGGSAANTEFSPGSTNIYTAVAPII